ncbi:leucine-rich repeat-containing protein 23-like [Aedes aegypti]|uniref:Uncharacterized protein n=1 Tax=Aedes aegypti TaxID=7159 RepID=A0A6I8U8K5_AEDAE|nr:leucine-rich repeat-containing protein 23-like [Aedes aegypti]
MQLKLIWFQLLFANAFAVHYQCLPYPMASVCIVEYISYRPGDVITFPTGYQQYQVKESRSKRETVSRVTAFDEVLYKAMHQPSIIEMASVHMEKLVLPPTLLLGDFAYNDIHSVNVSHAQTYQVSSLDFRDSKLTNIDFVASLVNLEMLHLERNKIRTIPGSILRLLTKLKHLYLQGNSFETIPWTDLPCGLIHLDSFWSSVKSVDFSNVSLPSLEYLNIRDNQLTAINVTALLLAAPKLKEVYLYNRQIDEFRMDAIKAELTSNNISYVENYVYPECFHDDNHEYVNGKCVKLKDFRLAPVSHCCSLSWSSEWPRYVCTSGWWSLGT